MTELRRDPTSPRALEELSRCWGNKGYAARTGYLALVAQTARNCDGPILECGSGTSTLLLGAIAGQGQHVWTLEHDPFWAWRVRLFLRAHRIRSVTVLTCPLRSYGEYEWYDVEQAELPGDFSVVVCDGPVAEKTRGGRYGLLPVLGSHLRPGSKIVLDDADRDGELEVLSRWQKESGIEGHADGPFAVYNTPRLLEAMNDEKSPAA